MYAEVEGLSPHELLFYNVLTIDNVKNQIAPGEKNRKQIPPPKCCFSDVDGTIIFPAVSSNQHFGNNTMQDGVSISIGLQRAKNQVWFAAFIVREI